MGRRQAAQTGARGRQAMARTPVRVRRRPASDRLRRARDVRGHLGRWGSDRVAVRPARAVHAQLLLDRARLHRGHRRLSRPAAPTEAGPGPGAAFDPDGGRDAGLQRGHSAHLRGRSGDARGGRGDGSGPPIRLVRPFRHHAAGCLDRGGTRIPVPARRAGAGRAALLPPPPEEPSPQGRQYRRLRHPLGWGLRPYAGARRRQPADRHLHRPARRSDGGRHGCRHHPKPAAHHQPQHPVRPRPAIRRPHLWAGDRHRARRLVGPRRQLLDTTRSSARRPSRRPAACPTSAAGPLSAATCSATISSRRR